MKKILAVLLVFVTVFSMAACGSKTESSKKEEVKKEEPKTVGGKLQADFEANAEGSVQEIAEAVAKNDVLPFEAVIMEVEPGFLMGFDNAEITGFKKAVTFAPMMGTIPFLGYVFEVDDDVNVDDFMKTLKDSANLRWNICTEADEMIVEAEGNKVFFLMCPTEFEEVTE